MTDHHEPGWGGAPALAATPAPAAGRDHDRVLVTALLAGVAVWMFLLLVWFLGPIVPHDSQETYVVEDLVRVLVTVFLVLPVMVAAAVSVVGATLAMLPPLVRWLLDRDRPRLPGLFVAHAVLAWAVGAYLLLATPFAAEWWRV